MPLVSNFSNERWSLKRWPKPRAGRPIVGKQPRWWVDYKRSTVVWPGYLLTKSWHLPYVSWTILLALTSSNTSLGPNACLPLKFQNMLGNFNWCQLDDVVSTFVYWFSWPHLQLRIPLDLAWVHVPVDLSVLIFLSWSARLYYWEGLCKLSMQSMCSLS